VKHLLSVQPRRGVFLIVKMIILQGIAMDVRTISGAGSQGEGSKQYRASKLGDQLGGLGLGERR
jgi:hypothetical protein